MRNLNKTASRAWAGTFQKSFNRTLAIKVKPARKKAATGAAMFRMRPNPQMNFKPIAPGKRNSRYWMFLLASRPRSCCRPLKSMMEAITKTRPINNCPKYAIIWLNPVRSVSVTSDGNQCGD